MVTENETTNINKQEAKVLEIRWSADVHANGEFSVAWIVAERKKDEEASKMQSRKPIETIKVEVKWSGKKSKIGEHQEQKVSNQMSEANVERMNEVDEMYSR